MIYIFFRSIFRSFQVFQGAAKVQTERPPCSPPIHWTHPSNYILYKLISMPGKIGWCSYWWYIGHLRVFSGVFRCSKVRPRCGLSSHLVPSTHCVHMSDHKLYKPIFMPGKIVVCSYWWGIAHKGVSRSFQVFRGAAKVRTERPPCSPYLFYL